MTQDPRDPAQTVTPERLTELAQYNHLGRAGGFMALIPAPTIEELQEAHAALGPMTAPQPDSPDHDPDLFSGGMPPRPGSGAEIEPCWFCGRHVGYDYLIAGYDTFEEQRLACLDCDRAIHALRDKGWLRAAPPPGPALNAAGVLRDLDEVSTYVIAFPWPAGTGMEEDRQKAIAALDRMLAALAAAASAPLPRQRLVCAECGKDNLVDDCGHRTLSGKRLFVIEDDDIARLAAAPESPEKGAPK